MGRDSGALDSTASVRGSAAVRGSVVRRKVAAGKGTVAVMGHHSGALRDNLAAWARSVAAPAPCSCHAGGRLLPQGLGAWSAAVLVV
jgi:hypothetical protein